MIRSRAARESSRCVALLRTSAIASIGTRMTREPVTNTPSTAQYCIGEGFIFLAVGVWLRIWKWLKMYAGCSLTRLSCWVAHVEESIMRFYLFAPKARAGVTCIVSSEREAGEGMAGTRVISSSLIAWPFHERIQSGDMTTKKDGRSDAAARPAA